MKKYAGNYPHIRVVRISLAVIPKQLKCETCLSYILQIYFIKYIDYL